MSHDSAPTGNTSSDDNVDIEPITSKESVVPVVKPATAPVIKPTVASAVVPAVTTETSAHTDDQVDTLMLGFDHLLNSIDSIGAKVAEFDSQPHDQARIAKLLECIVAQQKQNEMLYDLLVKMNNFFGM